MRILAREWEATLLLIGTIVGVGMFGIPLMFVAAGFFTGLIELALLTAVMILVHLAYTGVVVHTPTIHRLPGYLALYFGKGVGRVAVCSYLFGFSGTLLAYLVLGGFFLGEIARWTYPGLPEIAGPAAFYALGVLIIFRSIRFEGFANAILTAGLVLAIVGTGITLLPSVEALNLTSFRPDRLAIPYGVLLFSLAGSAVIPDMRRLLGNNTAALPRLVCIGTIIPAILYALFAFAVVGVTGDATTPDAVSGIAERFGNGYLLLGSVIGFLAAITSFITLGDVFKGMLISDLGFSKFVAPFLTAAIPAALYLFGFQDFIMVVSVVGAIAIGLDSILMLLMHHRIGTGSPAPFAFSGVLYALFVAMFAVGIVVAVIRVIP